MTKQRRTVTPEFKRGAASLVLDQGYSHIKAARLLGLVESACVGGPASSSKSAAVLPRPARARRCYPDQQGVDA